MQKKNEKDRYWEVRQLGLLSTIPALLTVSPIVGFLIGRFLDRKLNTDPFLGIVFLVLGFLAGARQVARVIKLAGKEKEKDNSRGA